MQLPVGRAVVAVAAGLAVLTAAPAALAKTKSVDAGTPAAYQKQIQRDLGSDVNAFFPRTIAVNVGDSVKFTPRGFHNIDFPKKGGSALPLITPTGTKVAGAVDAAGAAFWFNGQDQLGFNAKLLKSGWGKKVSFTGSKAINSGLPFGPPKPYTVKFTKAGTFSYFCDVHPGMKGTVRVRDKDTTVPTQKSDNQRATAQAKAAVAVAKGLTNVQPPAGRVDIGVAGAGGVELFAFVPSSLTVPVGTSLTFAMSAGSREAHTATTGPGNIEDPSSFIGTLAKAYESPVFDPASAVYPSEVPGTFAGLTPTLHGNGFWNSGALDAAGGTPLQTSATVRFDAPGNYPFYCLIHPFMRGTITVQ